MNENHPMNEREIERLAAELESDGRMNALLDEALASAEAPADLTQRVLARTRASFEAQTGGDGAAHLSGLRLDRHSDRSGWRIGPSRWTVWRIAATFALAALVAIAGAGWWITRGEGESIVAGGDGAVQVDGATHLDGEAHLSGLRADATVDQSSQPPSMDVLERRLAALDRHAAPGAPGPAPLDEQIELTAMQIDLLALSVDERMTSSELIDETVTQIDIERALSDDVIF